MFVQSDDRVTGEFEVTGVPDVCDVAGGTHGAHGTHVSNIAPGTPSL